MAEIIQSLRRTRPQRASEFPWPAPVRGQNTRDSEADMGIQYARTLVNIRPDSGFVETRRGSRTVASVRFGDGPVIDTVPPQIGSGGLPPTQVIPAGACWEFSLLEYLAVETEPILFEIVRIEAGGGDTDWLNITEHGVLYGIAPAPDSAQTFQITVRATDPARNSLEFPVTAVVLAGEAPVLPDPGAQLPVPADITASRIPSWSPLVVVDFEKVDHAARYEVRWSPNPTRASVGVGVGTSHVLTFTALPGAEHNGMKIETEYDSTIANNSYRLTWDAVARTLTIGLRGVFVIRNNGNISNIVEDLAATGMPATVSLPEGASAVVTGRWEATTASTTYTFAGGQSYEWTTQDEPASYDLIVIRGTGNVGQVRAISDDPDVEDSDWSADFPIPDQTGRPIGIPLLGVFRADDNYSDSVRIEASEIPQGVERLAIQVRQGGVAWNAGSVMDVTFAAGATAHTLTLAGAGWQVRWAPFTVEAGRDQNAPGQDVNIPDQIPIPTPDRLTTRRTPNLQDATVDIRWDQSEHATGYELEIFQAGVSNSGVTRNGRTATSHQLELANDNWTVRVRALAPTGWLNSEWSQQINIADQEAAPREVATGLVVVRPILHKVLVRATWTPNAAAVEQIMEWRVTPDGTWGVRTTAPATIEPDTGEIEANIPGINHQVRVGTRTE